MENFLCKIKSTVLYLQYYLEILVYKINLRFFIELNLKLRNIFFEYSVTLYMWLGGVLQTIGQYCNFGPVF